MKKHLLILLLIPSLAISQEIGTREIVITNDNTALENHIEALKVFMAKGYEIDEKDDLFHTVLFEPKKHHFPSGNREALVYIILSMKSEDGKITLSMQDKRRGKRKMVTIFDPGYMDTVHVFNTVTNIATQISGKMSFVKDPNYEPRKKPQGNRDDVYGIIR